MKHFVVYTMLFLLIGIALGSGVVSVNLNSVNFVPVGSVIIWTGHANDFSPWGYLINNTDWHLCNGNNGTTNLEGKFIVGYDPEDNDYDFIGETGGEKEHTLTIDEMPYHEHNYDDIYHRINRRNLVSGNIDNAEGYSTGGMSSTTTGAGGSKPHENRPPYYVVAYIQCIN